MIAITATSVKFLYPSYAAAYISLVLPGTVFIFIFVQRRDLNGTPRTSRAGADP